jgi:nitrite reductase/ring-hydroxylating ferredoxin subunit
MAEVFVSKVAAMKDGDRQIVRTEDGREIGVFFSGGEYYGYSNYCAHTGGPACEGIMIPKVEELVDANQHWSGGTRFTDEMHFVCPWHGWEYDLKTGENVGDRKIKLKKFPVVLRQDDIFVVT